MIYIGADHGGYELKERVKLWLDEWGLKYEDLGAHTLVPEDDYPQYAFIVAEKVGKEDNMNDPWEARTKGILICRSAAGVAIAANKIKDIRAVAAYTPRIARHAREHDDANVLALGADFVSEETAREISKTFLETETSEEDRHQRRVGQVREKEYSCC